MKLRPEVVSNFCQTDPNATTMNGKLLILGKVASTALVCRKYRENIASSSFGGNGSIPETSTGSLKLPPNRRLSKKPKTVLT